MDIQTANPHGMDERIEGSYPESYRRLFPHVNQIVESMSDDAMYNMSPDDIDGLAVEAMARSGMSSDPSMAHNADVARVMVGRQLFDRHRRRGRGRGRFPLWPFLFMDYNGGCYGGYCGDYGYDGYRDGYRDFDGYRHRY
jgi:hypothetical protein